MYTAFWKKRNKEPHDNWTRHNVKDGLESWVLNLLDDTDAFHMVDEQGNCVFSTLDLRELAELSLLGPENIQEDPINTLVEL